MKVCKEYEINEGCLTLLLILENMFINEMVTLPKHIYDEVDKLYSMLIDEIERDYKFVDADNTRILRQVIYDPEKPQLTDD